MASQPTIERSGQAGEPGVSNIATAPTNIDKNSRPVARLGERKCRVFAER
jgi:hypothetical protein